MNGHHPSRAELDAYLRRRLPASERTRLRTHLDDCRMCWGCWNRHRWDAALGHPLLDQLTAFLGPGYRPYLDSSRALADDWDRADPRTPAEIARFFRTSVHYLYNLTVWEASGNRPGYLDAALPHLQALPVHTVLDIGSGIGSDALALRRHGYSVTTCEFDSPSSRFCTYRADPALRRIDPPDLRDADAADVLWIIDTLDHLPDPEQALHPLLTTAHTVVTEDLREHRGHGNQRFHHRRSWTSTRALFARHGFAAHPHPPVIIWRGDSPTTMPKPG